MSIYLSSVYLPACLPAGFFYLLFSRSVVQATAAGAYKDKSAKRSSPLKVEQVFAGDILLKFKHSPKLEDTGNIHRWPCWDESSKIFDSLPSPSHPPTLSLSQRTLVTQIHRKLKMKCELLKMFSLDETLQCCCSSPPSC